MPTSSLESSVSLYKENLDHPRWKRLRLEILDRDGHRCRICGSTNALHVHHRQYHRKQRTGEWLHPWEYHPVFLVTLCATCHQLGHQQFSIPIKNI